MENPIAGPATSLSDLVEKISIYDDLLNRLAESVRILETVGQNLVKDPEAVSNENKSPEIDGILGALRSCNQKFDILNSRLISIREKFVSLIG